MICRLYRNLCPRSYQFPWQVPYCYPPHLNRFRHHCFFPMLLQWLFSLFLYWPFVRPFSYPLLSLRLPLWLERLLLLVLRPLLVVSLLLPLAVLLFSLPLPQPQCLPSSLLPDWQDRYLPIPVRLWIRSISAFSHSVFQYVLHFLFDFHRGIPMSLLVYLSLH